MNHPVKIVQVELSGMGKPPTPTGTAPNNIPYPDPKPELGQFVKW
jgi:hypothetical protein